MYTFHVYIVTVADAISTEEWILISSKIFTPYTRNLYSPLLVHFCPVRLQPKFLTPCYWRLPPTLASFTANSAKFEYFFYGISNLTFTLVVQDALCDRYILYKTFIIW
jgi:hypothetical protein